jgi:hypothetical protein
MTAMEQAQMVFQLPDQSRPCCWAAVFRVDYGQLHCHQDTEGYRKDAMIFTYMPLRHDQF